MWGYGGQRSSAWRAMWREKLAAISGLTTFVRGAARYLLASARSVKLTAKKTKRHSAALVAGRTARIKKKHGTERKHLWEHAGQNRMSGKSSKKISEGMVKEKTYQRTASALMNQGGILTMASVEA